MAIDAQERERFKHLFDGTKNYGGGIGARATLQDQTTAPAKTPGTKIVQPYSGFTGKVAAVGTQTSRIAGQGMAKLGNFVVNSAADVGMQGIKAVRSLTVDPIMMRATNAELNRHSEQLDNIRKGLTTAYTSGKLSKKDYIDQLRRIADSQNNISKMSEQVYSEADPSGRAAAVVETGANILSLGRAQSVKMSAKGVAKNPSYFMKAAKNLEDAFTKVPAVRDLLARNAEYASKRLVGETTEQMLKRTSKEVAIGLLIKRPVFYESNIGGAREVYQGIIDGDYQKSAKSAAWMATQMISGGPLGFFYRNGGKFAGKTRELAVGKQSWMDEISKRIGGDIGKHLNDLKESSPKDYDRAVKALRIAQEVNLRAADDDVLTAAEHTLAHYADNNIDIASIKPGEFIDDLYRWSEADKIAQKMGNGYVAVRWDSGIKNGLANSIKAAGNDYQKVAAAIEEFLNRPGAAWANNRILQAKINSIMKESSDVNEMAKRIREIPTVALIPSSIDSKAAQRAAKLGYALAEPFDGRKTPVVTLDDARNLVSSVAKGENVDFVNPPSPIISSIASFMRKLGLSPESSTNRAYDQLGNSLAMNLNKLDVAKTIGITAGDETVKGAKAMLYSLQHYIEAKAPALPIARSAAVNDVRQLRVTEIAEALKISRADAKKVSQAIMRAYVQTPLETRGLGDRLVDYNYLYNPLHKYYSRIQGALRYTYNPFFRTQEMAETKIFSKMKANNLLWMRHPNPLENRRILNEAAKKLDAANIFTTGYSGEGAADLILGRITANITNVQRRDLAGLALKLADRKGINLDEMIKNHPDELEDALRVIVQYRRHGALSSPLARTINVAFFPMRYNLKVADMAAREIGKLPPSLQFATLNSILSLRDYFRSEEGIRWQSENSDALAVFKWVTPYNSIESAMRLFGGNKPNSVSELGMLGGLPFGVISQVLESMGIINLNTPYVNPKTGEMLPEYIPETAKAKAATATLDILNSMFTYPGRILGLPGKEATTRGIVKAFIDTNGSDFTKKYDVDKLTPMQKKWIDVIKKGDALTQDDIDELYTSPAPEQFNWYTLPPLEPLPQIGQKVPVMTRVEAYQAKRATKGSRKKYYARPMQ